MYLNLCLEFKLFNKPFYFNRLIRKLAERVSSLWFRQAIDISKYPYNEGSSFPKSFPKVIHVALPQGMRYDPAPC